MNAAEKLKDIFRRVLQVDDIDDTTSPETVPAWDSFNALTIVSEIEKGFKINFTLDEVTAMRTVADIRKVLKKKGVAL